MCLAGAPGKTAVYKQVGMCVERHQLLQGWSRVTQSLFKLDNIHLDSTLEAVFAQLDVYNIKFQGLEFCMGLKERQFFFFQQVH